MLLTLTKSSIHIFLFVCSVFSITERDEWIFLVSYIQFLLLNKYIKISRVTISNS